MRDTNVEHLAACYLDGPDPFDAVMLTGMSPLQMIDYGSKVLAAAEDRYSRYIDLYAETGDLDHLYKALEYVTLDD